MDNSCCNILIVDDNPIDRKLISSILSKAEYEYTHAVSGNEALKLISKYVYDIVLLDVNMPEMSGIELCKKIKDDENYKDVPIIFLTWLDDTKSIVEGFAAGGSDYISKPFNKEELLIRIKTHFQLKISVDQIKLYVKELKQKNKWIIESINYSNRIQKALLPSEQNIQDSLSEFFLIFKPKDIVSGDFYWFYKENDVIYIAIADCTGHGIPGAFMSVMGISFLNEIITKGKNNPSEILNQLKTKILYNFKAGNKTLTVNDGLDIGLCRINTSTQEIMFSGAFFSLFMFDGNDIIEVKGNRQPIGNYEKSISFEDQTISIKDKNYSFYMTSDGFIDQFGGENDKKFTKKNFIKLLKNNGKKSLKEQKNILEYEFYKWKKNTSQIDDIIVCGFKV